ncbi:MAG: general stress protein, partial [Gemmatimonadales bacterium]
MNPPRKTTNPTREGGTIVALFRRQPQAERAIRDLKDAGFSTDRIGVVMQDPARDQQLTHETDTMAGEGATAGAISGGVIGGVLGLLAGVGALAIP